jgi:hypothetical protein
MDQAGRLPALPRQCRLVVDGRGRRAGSSRRLARTQPATVASPTTGPLCRAPQLWRGVRHGWCTPPACRSVRFGSPVPLTYRRPPAGLAARHMISLRRCRRTQSRPDCLPKPRASHRLPRRFTKRVPDLFLGVLRTSISHLALDHLHLLHVVSAFACYIGHGSLPCAYSVVSLLKVIMAPLRLCSGPPVFHTRCKSIECLDVLLLCL